MDNEYVILTMPVQLRVNALSSLPGNITLTNRRMVYVNSKESIGVPVTKITGARDGALGIIEVYYDNSSLSFAFTLPRKKIFLPALKQIVCNPEEKMKAFSGAYVLPSNLPIAPDAAMLIETLTGTFYHCDEELVFVSKIIRTEDVVMPYREIVFVRIMLEQIVIRLQNNSAFFFGFDKTANMAEINELVDLVHNMQELLHNRDADALLAEEKAKQDEFVLQHPVTGQKASYATKELWVSNNDLCICNQFDEENPDFVGHALPLDEIAYFSIEGKIEKETVTTGDTAAVLGEALFGKSYKAGVGSAKHNMKTKTVEHDKRYVVLKMTSGEQFELFLAAYDALQIVIPEKEKSVVEEVRHNQAVHKSDPPVSDVAADTEKIVKAIQSLAELEKAGILTKEEFELKKKQLLGL